jgi:hypothetical protein
MYALAALGVAGAVKQHALQCFQDAGMHTGPHDVGAVQALAAQIRVSVVVLVVVHAVGAVGANFVHDAADAHDPVGVVVHFQHEQRRFVRDVGLDGHGAFVNAGVVGIRGEPRGSLGPCFIVIARNACGVCLVHWYWCSVALDKNKMFNFYFIIWYSDEFYAFFLRGSFLHFFCEFLFYCRHENKYATLHTRWWHRKHTPLP